MHLVVLLRARNGDLGALRDYEALVLPIVKDHGGRLVAAFRPEGSGKPSVPDEIHILSFPGRHDLNAFREDERHDEIAMLRARAIERTVVYTPAEVVNYGIKWDD